MNQTIKPTPTLTDVAERFDEIAYQLIMLYQRWQEDQQRLTQQNKQANEIMQLISDKMESFKQLATTVRQDLAYIIKEQIKDLKQDIARQLIKITTDEVKQITQELQNATTHAQHILKRQEVTIENNRVKQGLILVMGVIICLCSAFLIAHFEMPAPTLPLTDTQLHYLYGGELMQRVFNKMPQSEQDHLRKMVDEIQHEQSQQQ